MSEHPEWGTEDYRRFASLFNDITRSPVQRFIHLSDRTKIAEYLWQQGWRREVRDEDVTENKRMRDRTIDGGIQRGEAEYDADDATWPAANSGTSGSIISLTIGDTVFVPLEPDA